MVARPFPALMGVLAALALAACAPAEPPAPPAGDAVARSADAPGGADRVAVDAEQPPALEADGSAADTNGASANGDDDPAASEADAIDAPIAVVGAEVAAEGDGAAETSAAQTSGPGVAVDDAMGTERGAPQAAPGPRLPDLGPAPELSGAPWLNTDQPRDLAALRGKVVLVEFWTFGCFNCRNVLPHVAEWHARYAGDAFEVVGVHYPEFAFERDVDNVRGAIAELGVAYPVAVDNDGTTWRAWDQRYWPTLYLIDHEGRIRYTHIGEGGYEATEAAIQALIAEAGKGAS